VRTTKTRTRTATFDPPEERPRKRTRRDPNDGLSPAARAARRAAFGRAAIGVKLIWASFGLFAASMMFFNVYFFQSAFSEPSNAFIVFAGLFGLFNWLLAAVGVGLCLSGPAAPGHWGYGIGAAVAVVVHLVLLAVLLGQGGSSPSGGCPARAAGCGGRWCRPSSTPPCCTSPRSCTRTGRGTCTAAGWPCR
jgi:hypothetical protein